MIDPTLFVHAMKVQKAAESLAVEPLKLKYAALDMLDYLGAQIDAEKAARQIKESAMTDTPTPDTPAVPEPVAWTSQDQLDDAAASGLGYLYAGEWKPEKADGALYSAAQMQALADRLAECEKEREDLNNLDFWEDTIQRATTAEAALESARKVIEPFAAAVDVQAGASFYLNFGHLRAASEWLSANPKETNG